MKLMMLVVAVAVVSTVPAVAQVVPVPETVIRLDEEVIEAAPPLRPVVPVFGADRRASHKSLILIRKDFRHEVLSSIERL